MAVKVVWMRRSEPMITTNKTVPRTNSVVIDPATSNIRSLARPSMARINRPTANSTSNDTNSSSNFIICTRLACVPVMSALRMRTPKYEMPDTPPLGNTWFTKFSSSATRNMNL